MGHSFVSRAGTRVMLVIMTVMLLCGAILVADADSSRATAAEAAPVDVGVAAAPVGSAANASVGAGVVKTADLSQFQPGNIVSDAVFFDSSTMSAGQIQDFLNGKVRSCQSGYTCLKDFRQTTSSRAASAYCNGYSGASNESAATIIYKVAVSCGINPQALLVILQKEQGLVTHTWPSDWRYTIAMGQGCPDTSGCDTTYYGFQNQVYGAARQFKIYAEGRYFTWYAPGRTWNILYNPNSGCGSSPVYIQNKATAGLYYYTPYQPNAAALRAGYGEGDGCSAYGNRNFYNYFTDWFGSTQSFPVLGDMGARWAALGGAAGVLGAPTATEVCDWTVGNVNCYQNFQNGAISWTPATGAWETHGDIRARWRVVGFERGPLGYPVGGPVCGQLEGGCYQNFQNGAISWTPATGAWETYGDVRARWLMVGAEGGPLGYPIGARTCGTLNDGCYQGFQNGAISWTKVTGAWETYGDVRARWRGVGAERGPRGYPVGGPVCGQLQGGCYQNFQNGAISWTPATGAWETYGVSRSYWASTGYERGVLGYPVSGPVAVSGGAVSQRFQRGTVASSAAGVFRVLGNINVRWQQLDGQTGVLGSPVGEEVCSWVPGRENCYQNFQNGAISWTPVTGAWETYGAIRSSWARQGFEFGKLGYPTGAVQKSASGASQSFQGGVVSVQE